MSNPNVEPCDNHNTASDEGAHDTSHISGKARSQQRAADHRLIGRIPNRGAFVARPGVEIARGAYGLRRASSAA
ncbi:hypothetical protein [Paraburkholderia caffeinilytica]|uniref:hypothetical protein n=1 Tax=Paraburkholderia caffeinilytica TaxID=1761016 RepID=UPI0038B970DB